MIEYILFGEKNTYTDYNLLIQSLTISQAEAKEEIVDIPGADGVLDFSESLAGDVKYNNRLITISLADRKNEIDLIKYSKIQNDLHGKTMRIIISDDLKFYYYGKIKVIDYDKFATVKTINIECNVEPYKYDIRDSSEHWLWDSFEFATDIANDTCELEVDGSLKVLIYGLRKRVIPKFICSNEMKLIFNNMVYTLPAGTSYVTDVEIQEGNNVLIFRGNGIVTIEYRGGSL